MTLFADFEWRVFFMLVTAGALGGIAVLPYALELQADRIDELPMSMTHIVALSLAQGVVLMAVVVTLGMLAANAQNLIIPSAVKNLPLAVGAGIMAGAAIVLLERVVFMPFLPETLQQSTTPIAVWKRFLASFYGGFTEEILMRLFLMSVLAFVLSRFWDQPLWVLWMANVIAAFVFGLLHLPTVAAIVPLSLIVIVRTVILNMVGGVIFGGLFIHYGLTAAFAAHFTADIVLHILTPILFLSGG